MFASKVQRCIQAIHQEIAGKQILYKGACIVITGDEVAQYAPDSGMVQFRRRGKLKSFHQGKHGLAGILPTQTIHNFTKAVTALDNSTV